MSKHFFVPNYLLEIELTTVVQDITMIAEQACQMMFQKFTKEEIEKKEIILLPTACFILRNSPLLSPFSVKSIN